MSQVIYGEIGPVKSASPAARTAVIIIGVSGCEKSTKGALLASLRWEFEDADRFHPASNVNKMHSGIPLTDEEPLALAGRGCCLV